jgi:hypothetical protein
MGFFDQTGFVPVCTCESSFFVSEQFTLKKSIRNGSTVHGYKSSIVSFGHSMDYFGKKFFSSTAFSANQHGGTVGEIFMANLSTFCMDADPDIRSLRNRCSSSI